jgi:hypothetical protein
MKQFTKDKIYFRLLFSDANMKVPLIETFVFVGENLSNEDIREVLYFRPAADFVRYGMMMSNEGSPMVCFDADDAARVDEMISVTQLCEVLKTLRE